MKFFKFGEDLKGTCENCGKPMNYNWYYRTWHHVDKKTRMEGWGCFNFKPKEFPERIFINKEDEKKEKELDERIRKKDKLFKKRLLPLAEFEKEVKKAYDKGLKKYV